MLHLKNNVNLLVSLDGLPMFVAHYTLDIFAGDYITYFLRSKLL
jgi:hypothetical protein